MKQLQPLLESRKEITMPEKRKRIWLPEGQTVWAVEKFIPTRCPAPQCWNKFQKCSKGSGGYFLGTFFLHETLETSGIILRSISCPHLGTDLIVCAKCKNVTLRVNLEQRRYAKREDATAALKEGFRNLHALEVFGNHQIRGRDVHVLRPSAPITLLRFRRGEKKPDIIRPLGK